MSNIKFKSMNKILVIISILVIPVVIARNLIDLSPSTSSDFKVKGIDISHHNRVYNWNKVGKQNDFCIMKATEGSGFVDGKFNTYWNNTKQSGMYRGAYHFFSPGISAEKQFENFRRHVKLGKNDLPPILDVELKNCNIDEVNKWLKLAENYYGVKPIVYSDYFFFKLFMERKLDNYPLWLHMNKKYSVKPSFNNFDCVIWQYNQYGKINGINGNVDLNTFLGDSEKFKELLIH